MIFERSDAKIIINNNGPYGLNNDNIEFHRPKKDCLKNSEDIKDYAHINIDIQNHDFYTRNNNEQLKDKSTSRLYGLSRSLNKDMTNSINCIEKYQIKDNDNDEKKL